MSSDNEYFSENDDVQPNSINLEDSPREISIIEDESGGNDDQQNENNKDESKKVVVKPKRIIRNPAPKFNEHTIRNEKGLPALLNHFKDVKFKGHGHEEEDLNKLLKIYEYWCHRFYPKFTFDDCIRKLEALGNKKSTQIYLKKMRMGIEDFYQETSGDNIQTEGFVEPFDDHFSTLMHEPEPELTEAQIEKIKQNKLRAEAIRRERLSRINGQPSQKYSVDTVCENDQHDLEVQLSEEELGIDNILKMVNEDSVSSSSEAALNKNEEQSYDKKISNAIRRNILSDSENEESSNDVTKLHKRHSPESKEASEDDKSNHSAHSYNSTASSNESTLLHSSQLGKLKGKSKKQINNQRSFRRKRNISTDSDDTSQSSCSLQHPSSQKKKKSISSIIKTLSDNDDEPVQSNGSTDILIKENPRNITDEDVNQNIDNFVDSDELNSFDNARKHIHGLKPKRRLIVDSDESD
ncbi:TIMELESS-interacting protein [Diorhabda sublineata]|uniref:TIMELESS-interacting protein n=1 Tax=Diorhabda sublineata TaxID=1163346 RepID=UPI0024E18BA7|nr:TIMELESS-interacting protein [Diorhabda sublineata]